jgi:serine/threonine protein kinase
LEALNVLLQISQALKEGHKVAITHQWLSPRTVLVDEKQRVKLVGLGLRDVLAKHDHTSRAYLSPETAEGHEGSPASDIFSLGLLGVELLQAFMPAEWSPSNLEPDDVGWPEETCEAVPAKVRRLLLACLRNEPMKRPSADEVHKGLSSVGFLPGQILADRYVIEDELGRGGMSRVYRARDRQFAEEVAIKTMINLAADSSDERDRLFREVQICRKISHPNVVRVHDFGELPGGVFIIMELLDGPGLDEVIENDAPLPLARTQTILTEIAAALSEAHRLKVVHRDLKPANVILVKERVKVMDFGIAHLSDESSKQLTRAGEVVGSPLYMAPEQIQGLPLGDTCDLYALGIIAYALLTGKEPFQADTATAVVFKHLHESPPDIREHRPNLPNAWIEMLTKLLAKKPEDRYQSARELTGVLERLPV